tara:strand:+ start:668 stop:1903 length:1236 start_codon:yes stop_codon:yes gene_type:complete
MSYNGSGTFQINSAGQPVVTGTTISSTAFNALTADLATGLSTALTKDGQTTPTANIPMGGYKITGLANATLSTDAMAYGQFTAFGTPGYTTTATAAGTTTLTLSSTQQQFFTGSTTQTVVLPVTSTLVLGQTFRIVNMSTGVVTVNSSGGNAVVAMVALSEVTVTCILTSGTSAASWDIQYTGKSAVTGTGSMVLATSPTLVTPTLGVATATTVNKVTFTAPATGSTLTIADGKVLTANSSLTLAGTDSKTLTVSNSGTLAGGDGFTLAIAASKTLTVSNSLTLAGTDSTTMTFPSVSATVAALNIEDQTLSGGANVTSKSLTTGSISVDCGDRPIQYITNNGAYTITAPSSDGSCFLFVTNGASAAATTFSGFTVGTNTGDALTTTNTNKFTIMVWRANGTSGYMIFAHQ